MSDRDSNNAIKHAINEWEGINAGPAHGVLVRAANELLALRAMVKRLEEWAEELDRLGHLYEMTQREFAAELRKRMGGDRG